jgi:hypothetical protein
MQRLKDCQARAFLEQKRSLKPGEALFIINFSQYQLEKGSVQVLHSAAILYDAEANDHLCCYYYNYVGDEGVPNNVNFVAGFWQHITWHLHHQHLE